MRVLSCHTPPSCVPAARPHHFLHFDAWDSVFFFFKLKEKPGSVWGKDDAVSPAARLIQQQ